MALFGDPAYVPFPGGLPNAATVDQPEALPGPAVAEELKLAPGRNEYVMRGGNGLAAMVIQYLPDRSFPNAGYAALSDHEGVRALFRFDLKRVALAPGATLKKATLRLYAKKPVSVPEPGLRPFGLHLVTSSWNAEVTWNSMPGFEAAAFTAGLFERVEKWLEFDVTAAVQGWLADPGRNQGILLKFDKETQQPAVAWNLIGPLEKGRRATPAAGAGV